MSFRKNSYSMPRTQPTKSSSRPNTDKKNIENQPIITCPQVSSFQELQTSIYMYNLDYGKLNKPKQLKLDSDADEDDTNEYTRRRLPVYKSTEIHRFRDNSGSKIQNILGKKLTITQSVTELKKDLNQTNDLRQKIKVKLNEVRAYEQMCNKQTSRQNKQRKKIHSRILKTYVGGAPMKTKIITYPDTSEYHKICASNK